MFMKPVARFSSPASPASPACAPVVALRLKKKSSRRAASFVKAFFTLGDAAGHPPFFCRVSTENGSLYKRAARKQ